MEIDSQVASSQVTPGQRFLHTFTGVSLSAELFYLYGGMVQNIGMISLPSACSPLKRIFSRVQLCYG
jgi:hypothetical protein